MKTAVFLRKVASRKPRSTSSAPVPSEKSVLQSARGPDFPTTTFRLLYGFLVLDHGRRRIRHLGVTEHPTAEWTRRQLVDAFPFNTAPRFLHRDRDSIFDTLVRRTVSTLGIEEVLSAPRSPWQNPFAERAIGSIRRELLDQVIVLSETHARHLLRAYGDYYNSSRTHLYLEKDAPDSRKAHRLERGTKVVALPVLGGLHHRSERRAA